MNENIDLTKILEGCEGIELYSSIHGKVIFEKIQFCINNMPIIIISKEHNYHEYYIDGKYFSSYDDAECVLFPSKDQRDWSKFVRPIKEGTPIMCCEDRDDLERDYWVYRKYTKEEIASWLYVIPFKNFDPDDIEGSLEYNIQK